MRTEIKKGWSADKKFLLADGRLLRTSALDKWERKVMEFDFLKRIQELGLPTPEPIRLEVVGDEVWTTLEFIEGEDLRELLPTLSEASQYDLGVESGRILRKLHGLEAPRDVLDWEVRMLAKLERNVGSYLGCGIQISGADVILSFLEKNKQLLKQRPQVFHHGDFHSGNMILKPDGTLGIIDFNRCDFGDPWEEFCSIVFDSSVSPLFATGRVDGYFQGDVPLEFWRLLCFYTAMNLIYTIPWAIPYGEDEVAFAVGNVERFMEDYEHLSCLVPKWYGRKKNPDI